MKILIIGGGIGGIATALALLKEGIEPLLLEQAPALTEVGAGLVVAPNAMKALRHIGAAECVERNGVELQKNHLPRIGRQPGF